jgi:hypothetical protein
MNEIMQLGVTWWMPRMLLIVVALQMSCERRFAEQSMGIASAGGAVAAATEGRPGNWKKVIYECISKVEKSDAVFYVRGRPATGREVAEHMRKNMKVILRMKSIPEPFGWNAGILLAAITRYEGYAMDGVTGPADPFEVEVQGRRVTVYEWLKEELGLGVLPGEEEGHEILPPLYEAVVTGELLEQWEEYLDKCIKVTEAAGNCRFWLRGKWFTSAEAAQILRSNRERALRYLKYPDITSRDDRDLYDSTAVLIRLTNRAPPKREEFKDQQEFLREVELWVHSRDNYVECKGVNVDFLRWLIRNAGEPPPMPKLRRRR